MLLSKSSKRTFFREFLSFGNQIDKKSKPKNLPRDGQLFEYWKALNSNEGCRGWSPMSWIDVGGTWKKPLCLKENWRNVLKKFVAALFYGSATGDCASYNCHWFSKAPKTQRTDLAMVKISVRFFVYFVSNWRETSEKRPFCSLGRKQCLCLNHLRQELAFKTNKNRSLKIFYLKLGTIERRKWRPEEVYSIFFETEVFFNFHQCQLTTRESTPYNSRYCSKASYTQRTDHLALKITVCFFC